jgi:4-cresol dehydrogenase (hydroxylating)
MAPLPPGMDEAAFAAVIQALTDALGTHAVTTDPAELREFRDPYSYREDDRRDCSVVVAPTTTEQVQAVVRIANEHGVPLWTIGQGRNNTYGGPAPRVKGSVLVNLRTMNQVLEINRELAYVVVEPGVRWFDLADALIADGNHLWTSIPDLGWGSVVGNALDNGAGYSPLSDHASNLVGLEVVLPDASVIRTGFGAQPGNAAWHTYNHGFGPSIDGLFRQSSFGIVTKAGYLVNRTPESYAACQLVFRGNEALSGLVDVLRDLMLDGTIINYPLLFRATELVDGEQLMSPGSDGWVGRFALYGRESVIDANLEVVRDRLAVVSGVQLNVRKFAGDDLSGPSNHDERVQRGVPDMELLDVERVPFGENFAHLDFSPVMPQTGAAVVAAEELVAAHFASYGLPFIGGILLRGRSVLDISTTFFDATDEAMTAAAYRSYEELLEKFAARGILPYRTNLDSMDAVARHLSFGGHALARFIETMKDAVDPNGIIHPGKSGIWPAAYRTSRVPGAGGTRP